MLNSGRKPAKQVDTDSVFVVMNFILGYNNGNIVQLKRPENIIGYHFVGEYHFVDKKILSHDRK